MSNRLLTDRMSFWWIAGALGELFWAVLMQSQFFAFIGVASLSYGARALWRERQVQESEPARTSNS